MRQSKIPKVMSFILIASAVLMFFLAALMLRDVTPPKIVIPPPPTLPNPNARDYFIKACVQMKESKLIGVSLPGKINGNKISLSNHEIARLLDENKSALRTFREGMKYPYQEPATRSMFALFPHYANFRSISRLLFLEAKSKQMKFDWNGAMNTSLENIEMGSKVPTGASLIGGLVGVAIEAIGKKSLVDTIPHLNSSSAKLGAKRVLQIVDKPISYTELLQEEKYTGQNGLMDLLYGKNSSKNSEFSLGRFLDMTREGGVKRKITSSDIKVGLKFLWVGKAQIIVNYSKYMDALIANSKQPYALHLPLPVVPDDPCTSILASVFTHARDKFVENVGSNAILTLNLALQAYKMDHNRYPSQLEELVPTYLKHLPADPRVLNGSFGYKREKIGYTLFSKSLK